MKKNLLFILLTAYANCLFAQITTPVIKANFGVDGELFNKRMELVKPIQDKVYNAVQKMAVSRGYDFVLDKSEGITIIFADPKLDKSEDVLKELGVKN